MTPPAIHQSSASSRLIWVHRDLLIREALREPFFVEDLPLARPSYQPSTDPKLRHPELPFLLPKIPSGSSSTSQNLPSKLPLPLIQTSIFDVELRREPWREFRRFRTLFLPWIIPPPGGSQLNPPFCCVRR